MFYKKKFLKIFNRLHELENAVFGYSNYFGMYDRDNGLKDIVSRLTRENAELREKIDVLADALGYEIWPNYTPPAKYIAVNKEPKVPCKEETNA